MKVRELAKDIIEECKSNKDCKKCKYDMLCYEANIIEPARWEARWEIDGLVKKLDNTLRLAKEISKFVE